MVNKKKKPILLLPMDAKELQERNYEYVKKDKDFKTVIDIFENAKKEYGTNRTENEKIHNSRLFKQGFEFASMISFYQMGGTDQKDGSDNL